MTPPVVVQDPQHEGCKAPYYTVGAPHDDSHDEEDATQARTSRRPGVRPCDVRPARRASLRVGREGEVP